ncbi:MAG TPA: hypothetical protein VHD56_11945 [Tepidisphaeraceae bacterium]|nr:hypothetical protein [Tepidisphaeraceae bacterium]
MDQVAATDSPVVLPPEPDDLIPRRFQWMCAPIVFGVLTFAMFFDVLFTSSRVISHWGNDLAMQFLAWRDYGFTQLAHGNLALWNSHVYGGAPFFAGFQSALLYPPNWIHLILPVPVAINWIVAIHVFMLGYFTYFWCRGRAIGISGSILAGVMFMFSGPYFLHLYAGHLPHLAVVIWTPLMLLTIDKLGETGSMRWCVLGVFATTMHLLAGHPQYVYYTGIILSIYTVLHMKRWQVPAGFIVMYFGAVAIAAVQLFAGIQAAGESVRSSGTDYSFASTFSLPPMHFITWLAPTFFGNVFLGNDETKELLYWSNGYLWEMSLFISISGLTMAVLGALRGQIRTVLVILSLIVICFVLALGRHTFLYKPMFDYLPAYSSFRGTVKFAYLGDLFICLLAAMGLDGLLRDRKIGYMALGNVAAAAIIMFMLGLFVWMSGSDGPNGSWGQFVASTTDAARQAHERWNDYLDALKLDPKFISSSASHAAAVSFLAGGTFLAIFALLWSSRFFRYAPYGILALASIEMFCFARTVRPTLDPAAAMQLPEAWKKPIADLNKDWRILMIPYDWWSLGMSLGFDGMTGNDPLILKRYAEAIYASQLLDPSTASQYLKFQGINLAVFQMLRCGMICETPIQAPLVAPQPKGAPRQFLQPLPVAMLTSNWTKFHSSKDLLSYLAAGPFDPTSNILLEEVPEIQMIPGNDSPGTVRVVNQSTDWLELQADVTRPAMLLVTNNYSTGWRIRPIESPQDHFQVMPANYCQIGVPLVAGKHHLILEYSPLAFRVGRWVSIFALLAYLGWTILLMRQARWFR